MKNETAEQRETTKTITPLFAGEISQLKVKDTALMKMMEETDIKVKNSRKIIERLSKRLKEHDERFTSIKVGCTKCY